MVVEHDAFLRALDHGKVIGGAFLDALDDDGAFGALLADPSRVSDATGFDVPALRQAVARDHAILCTLLAAAAGRDPKLDAVIEALAEIAAQATADAATGDEARRNRKVLVFSFFADTIDWLRQVLPACIAADARLSAYAGRIAAVAGREVEAEDASRRQAVWGFAPLSTDAPAGTPDAFDILLTTDVLAEGMNLQQCRNIINYDLPWNPMRLIQRHGRIDRIGSPHRRVFLRTVFPADRLEALLTLEARIQRKLAQAARSIGVATPPVEQAEEGTQVFAETRAEIERLARGDASLFNQGGTAAAVQSGEEYRQRRRDAIEQLPGQAGSGVRRGTIGGVVFCAEVVARDATHSFLRFIPADAAWRAAGPPVRELGPCLRLADCEEAAPGDVPALLHDAVFDLWAAARDDILHEWEHRADPANLQPRIAAINRQVAAHLRRHPPPDLSMAQQNMVLDIVEAPWPTREEFALREAFRTPFSGPSARSTALAAHIMQTGLEPYVAPAPLPPATAEDVRLVCWLAIVPQTEGGR
jgi:hypothetical protein